MSAIWALFHLDGQPVDEAHLQRMSAALAPFGQEAVGVWCDGPAGVGHRLMSFTPEDRLEQQPLVDLAKGHVFVVDGRLDNRPELARELEISSSQAHEFPDSVFVQRAYDTWGEACPAHLIGAVAFIVWDVQRRRLFAACTPGNNRPLFYYYDSRVLALATMPRGLLALPFVPRELNQHKLASFMLHAQQIREATFYRDVWRLRPGHTLAAEAGQLNVLRYWAPDLSRRLRYRRDEDYVEAFRELFERVVADHLRSLTGVAAMLSGGLDSSAVAVTAALQLKRQGGHLHTFTEVPAAGSRGEALPGYYNDETPYVRAIADAHDNLEATLVHTDGQFFLRCLPGLFEFNEAPLHATANLVWLEAILQSASQRNLRVVLGGDLGNLTISWAGQGLLCGYLRQGRLGAAWHEARAMARRRSTGSPAGILLRQGLWPLVPELLRWHVHQIHHPELRRNDTAVRSDYAAAQGVRVGAASKNYPGQSIGDGRQARYHLLINRTESHKAAWQAQFGVDVRDPTADQRVIDFCLAIPEDQYLRDGQTRWLIRRAMADRLPPEVLWNTRRGLQASDWFERLTARRAEIELAIELIGQDELARRVLDLERMRRSLRDWPVGQPADLNIHKEYDLVLAHGLMVACYLRWFRSNRPVDAPTGV